MNTASIGYMRHDGDFAILATLNNNDGLLGATRFAELVRDIQQRIEREMDSKEIQAIERQDAPDYVTIETA